MAAGRAGSAAAVCPPLSSPGRREEDASSASPSRCVSTGLSPTPLSVESSPSRVPALFLSPAAAAAPSRGDLSPAPGLGGAPGGHAHGHAPAEMVVTDKYIPTCGDLHHRAE